MLASGERKSSIILSVLVGLPGSGKTRVAKYLKETLSESWRKIEVIHVCYDELVPLTEQIEICANALNWKKSRNSILCGVECLVTVLLKQSIPSPMGEMENKIKSLAVKTQTDNDVIILVDDNMYYKSMRYEYFQLARKYALGFSQFYICCPLSIAKANNKLRKQQVPEEVIDVMASRLEIPDPQKNDWEKFTLTIPYVQNQNIPVDVAADIISAARNNPVSPLENATDERESSKLACSTSVVHQSDNILRKLLGEKMKAEKGRKEKSELKKLFGILNEVRQELLEDIKSGMVTLDPQVIVTLQESKGNGHEGLDKVVEHLYTCRLRKRCTSAM